MDKHCCEDMNRNVNYRCKEHADQFNCPDNLIYYNEKWDEYGIIVHDGGESYIGIHYCPWCGKKLSDSKADQWFDELENLGFEDPFFQDIPEKYKSDEWYK